MQIFLQYCYSAILNIELHCNKYCKKIIIFYLLSLLCSVPYLWLSLLCLSSLVPVSHLSHLPRRTQQLRPTNSCKLVTHESSSRNPWPTIQHGKTNLAKPTRRARRNQHGDPRPTNSQSTTHDPQPEQCEYELIMERMKFWVLLKPNCEI